MSAGRGALAEWAFIAVLALSCGVLAVLQFRWTGQITRDERDRARAQLENRLAALRGDFNTALFQSLNSRSLDDPATARGCLFSGSRFVTRNRGPVQWFAADANGRLVPSSAPDGIGDVSRFLDELPPGEAVWRNGFIVRDANGPGDGGGPRGFRGRMGAEPPASRFRRPECFRSRVST